MKFDSEKIDGFVRNNLKLFISMAVGILVFVGIIAVSVFFLSIRGEEQTMVPDVTGYELSAALLELQEKELYPRLQLRYSQTSEDKGLVLEQDPRPGTIVKAGRRIRLVVSQGVMISRVENYVGRNIDELRLDLQTIFASGTGSVPLISIREPLMYEFSPEAPGIVLQQSPEPGTGISGPMILDLVVSRGPEDTLIRVPSLTTLTVEEALEVIGRTGIDFVFSVGSRNDERPFSVISQNPAGDAMVKADTRVSIVISPPSAIESGEVFGILRYPMAVNPYPLALRLEALLPSGEMIVLLSTDYAGGELTVPYKLQAGTTLILYILNREIYRQTIIPPLETVLEMLTLDQL